jgi:hypothetical protein
MTRFDIDFVLRRAYEHATACAAALALTTVMMLSVSANAASHRGLTPSVTILVPTVTIEQVPN